MRIHDTDLGAACLALLLPALSLLFTLCQSSLEALALIITLFLIAKFFLQQTRVYYYCCPACARTVYRARLQSAGKWYRCHDCAGHLLQVPNLTPLQVVQQHIRRAVFKQPLQQIAFRASVAADTAASMNHEHSRR